jgi:cytochrome c biogenesis factor
MMVLRSRSNDRGLLMTSVWTVGLLILVTLFTLIASTNNDEQLAIAIIFYIDSFIFISFLFLLSYGIFTLTNSSTSKQTRTRDDST